MAAAQRLSRTATIATKLPSTALTFGGSDERIQGRAVLTRLLSKNNTLLFGAEIHRINLHHRLQQPKLRAATTTTRRPLPKRRFICQENWPGAWGLRSGILVGHRPLQPRAAPVVCLQNGRIQPGVAGGRAVLPESRLPLFIPKSWPEF